MDTLQKEKSQDYGQSQHNSDSFKREEIGLFTKITTETAYTYLLGDSVITAVDKNEENIRAIEDCLREPLWQLIIPVIIHVDRRLELMKKELNKLPL
nr:MAG: hypothetical protein [Microviridae sp.]